MDSILSKSDSRILKGFAILLVMFHHLFSDSKIYLIHQLVLVAKVGVAIFLILSGYGLTESIKNKSHNWKRFYKNRFLRLYIPYWIIYLTFTPISILIFKRTIDFGNLPFFNWLTEVFGLQTFFEYNGFINATWWFMSLIIGLYFLFPFGYWLIKKYGIIVLIFVYAFSFLTLPRFEIGVLHLNINFIVVWLLPFFIGIYTSLNANKKNLLLIQRRNSYPVILVISIIVTTLVSLYGGQFGYVHIHFLLGSLLILFVQHFQGNYKFIQNVLGVFGEVSYEIFLFHTFIYFYFFNKFFSNGNPIILFIALSLICLVIGLILRRISQYLLRLIILAIP